MRVTMPIASSDFSRGRVKFDLSVAKFNQEAFDELYGPQATAIEIDGMCAYGP